MKKILKNKKNLRREKDEVEEKTEKNDIFEIYMVKDEKGKFYHLSYMCNKLLMLMLMLL